MKNKILLIALLSFFGFSKNSIAQYCIPTYGTICTSGGVNDLIDNFWTTGGITDITNMNTGCNFLPDNYWYTGLALVTEPGAVITMNMQCGATYQQGFAVWIDWNQNFIFEPGEKVYASPTSGFGVYTGNFTVPAGIECGTYNMRVRCNFATAGGTIDPCNMQTFGETEDYLISVTECNETTICQFDTHTIDLTPQITNLAAVTGYSWSPAIGVADPTGGPVMDVSPMDSVTYTVTVFEGAVSYDLEYIVNVVPFLYPDAGLDDTICRPNNTVAYQLQGVKDDPTNAASWALFQGPTGTPAPPNAVFSPSSANMTPNVQVNYPGLYTFVLSEVDQHGICPNGTDTVQIIYSNETHTTTFTDPACGGDGTGSITITSTGTIGAVEYSFDGGTTYGPSNTTTGLSGGDYIVISRDPAGCTRQSTVTITEPPVVMVSAGPSDTTICENGSATLYASGSNYGTTFTYHWSHTTDLESVQMVGAVASSYEVYAENEFGCVSDPATVNVNLHNPISLTITANDSVCPGDGSAHTVTAAGGFNGYNYAWTANGAPFGGNSPTITMNPTSNTNYCVTVTDGCESSAQIICSQVIMREVPQPFFTSDTTEGCVPVEILFENNTNPALVGTVSWMIDGNEYTDSTFTHEFTYPGAYDISMTVTSPHGCVNSITAPSYILAHEIPEAKFTVSPEVTSIFFPNVTATNGTPGFNTYFWEIPGGNPTNAMQSSVDITYPDGIAAVYPITLYVTTEHNCRDSITKNVTIEADVIIYAPNTFTPDGDANNNSWRVYIEGIDIYDYRMMIFNKWGEIVWESYNPESSWDGSFAGMGLVQDGTYVWVINVKDFNSDKKHEFRGTVNVLR